MTDLTPRRPHVRLTRLALQDFRNYAYAPAPPRWPPRLPLWRKRLGQDQPDGSRLHALARPRPARAEFTDLIRRDADGQLARSWALSSDVRDGDIDRKLALSLEIDEQGRSKRTARLDGVNTTQNDLGELMRIIWLTPSMDRVFAGPAGDRRRFLDRQVMAHFPSHGLRRRRLREGDAPARPRRGAQAPRHVYRRHRRRLGPAPHGLRGRRQRDRRGAGRPRRPKSTW
jgi:DNA replication and repair protein RecF